MGCGHVNKIKETFMLDFYDEKITELEPCKCCCNIKWIYSEYKPKCKELFPDLNFVIDATDEYVSVSTEWYDWKITFDVATQDMILYQKEKNDDKGKNDYRQCTELGTAKSIGTLFKHMANEEKLAKYPVYYREYAAKIEKVAQESDLTIEFDGRDLYVITALAAWKIVHYHIPKDVDSYMTPSNYVIYISKHDKAKKIQGGDYKKLPQDTKRQKKYYKWAKKKEIKKSVKRVWEIFDEPERA